jgi:hypothetical protein
VIAFLSTSNVSGLVHSFMHLGTDFDPVHAYLLMAWFLLLRFDLCVTLFTQRNVVLRGLESSRLVCGHARTECYKAYAFLHLNSQVGATWWGGNETKGFFSNLFI